MSYCIFDEQQRYKNCLFNMSFTINFVSSVYNFVLRKYMAQFPIKNVTQL